MASSSSSSAKQPLTVEPEVELGSITQEPAAAASADVDLTESNTAAVGMVGVASLGSSSSNGSSSRGGGGGSEGSGSGAHVGLSATLRRQKSRMSAVLQASFPVQQFGNSNDLSNVRPGQSFELEEPVTTPEAVTALIITLVDCSIVLLPAMMANIGYMSAPLLLLAAGFATFECGLLIAQCCDYAELRYDVVVDSYETLAKVTLGPGSAVVVGIVKNLTLMGFVVVYMQLAVETIVGLARGDKPNRFDEPEGLIHQRMQAQVRFLMVLPAFLAMAFVRSLKQVARIAIFSSFAVAVVAGSLIIGCAWRGFLIPVCDQSMPRPWFNCKEYVAWDGRSNADGKPWVEHGQALAFFFFLYAGLSTVPTLRARLEDKTKMPKILRISYSFTSLLLLAIMCVGYFGWGSLAHENSLLGLSESIPKFPLLSLCGKECLLVSIFCASPVYTHCIFSSMEGVCSGRAADPTTRVNTFLRFVVLTILVGVTHLVPFVVQICSLISSVFVVFTDLMFPLLLFYVGGRGRQGRGYFRIVLHVLLLAFAITVLVTGFTGSLAKLQTQLQRKYMESHR